MKVFLIPPPQLPIPAVEGGAVETLITQLLEENECQGRLDLVCASIPHPEAEKQRYTHSRILYLPRPKATPAIRLRRILRRLKGCRPSVDDWYFAVEDAVRKEKPDLIVAEGGNLFEPSLIARRMGKSRSLLHLHGETQGDPALAQLYGGGLILSRYVRQVFLARCPLGHPYLLYNCIHLEQFSPLPSLQREERRKALGFTPEDFVVVFCGRIAPDKGIGELVEGFLSLNDPHCKLLVIGSPFFGAAATDPYMEQLQARAKALGDRIRFTGFVPNHQLREYYGAADLSCVPSVCQEAAGLSAIEAMACGLPVLATISGGLPEYLEGSQSLLAEQGPGLPERLAQGILALKQAPDRRAEMTAAGLEAAQRYGRKGYYDCFVSHLETFIKET